MTTELVVYVYVTLADAVVIVPCLLHVVDVVIMAAVAQATVAISVAHAAADSTIVDTFSQIGVASRDAGQGYSNMCLVKSPRGGEADGS